MNTVDTSANYRNCQIGKNDVLFFVNWLQERSAITAEEKERLVMLAAEFQRGIVHLG